MFGFLFGSARPQVVCTDGFTMSVQASRGHYSDPRSDEGPYEAVEVGFPSEVEPLLMEYIEMMGNNPVESVYPYVPVDVVQAIIVKHGGVHSDMAGTEWDQPGLPAMQR